MKSLYNYNSHSTSIHANLHYNPTMTLFADSSEPLSDLIYDTFLARLTPNIMPPTAGITNGVGDPIKVGTTGTISSLMSRELESMKKSPQASSSSQRKLQTAPVSVPCRYIPKRTQLRKNPPSEPGGSRCSSSNSDFRSPGDTKKPKPRRNANGAPMLGSSDDATVQRNAMREKVENKKGHTYIVEVVDLKCNNPVSSRLKKIGFSKLSESIA